ncbi:hypothetical protein Poli38472_001065 [Pythium oligandrum]|uniref:GTP-binding protein Parf n=1 Tax=Pythium oligandrum TaxID=41045 RepID=A0A8K1FQ06_PYTOL|nr:hypothetical protein Poli38472_001065 [Pythium oligandrum]|eukprot:TMW68909.1 hypothetical protein Poli38472_001065 [Pythium oligandrum]
MGNDASRPVGGGLSPSLMSPRMSPGVPSSPRTPSGSALRRVKSFASSASTPEPHDPKMDKTIQRMDKTIRKRVRGGITYNMKIVLRGDRGTGKTSLFQRLKGEPIPTTHAPTPQLQSATINWSYRVNSEESVKCEVWDVVDKGFHPGQSDANGQEPATEANANPFEAASLASNATNGAHLMATVDATTVDVYHETHGVVFLLDVTKPHTLEYVRQQLEKVPVHIPTLVLGNFRDCGHQRKIFKEDIQELLYGNPTHRHQQPVRRPHELLYFECSLLNCYGLKSLHQYFGVPFLQLKLQTIRQQLRIVEGEFASLKHDVQAKIAEQRYADYVDHIKTTGSDIRTGRRASSGSLKNVQETTTSGEKDPAAQEEPEKPAQDEDSEKRNRMERTQSSSSDIVMGKSHAVSDEATANGNASDEKKPAVLQQELEDLPTRASASLLAQNASALKIEYSEDERQTAHAAVPSPEKPVEAAVAVTLPEPSAVTTKQKSKSKPAQPAPSRPPRKLSADESMNLEDFQVPKARFGDLDNFYSEDESDDEQDGSDDDVVVPPVGGGVKVGGHKQVFLDSDSSDAEEENVKFGRQQRGRRSPQQKETETTNSTVVAPSPPAVPSPVKQKPSPLRHLKEQLKHEVGKPADEVVEEKQTEEFEVVDVKQMEEADEPKHTPEEKSDVASVDVHEEPVVVTPVAEVVDRTVVEHAEEPSVDMSDDDVPVSISKEVDIAADDHTSEHVEEEVVPKPTTPTTVDNDVEEDMVTPLEADAFFSDEEDEKDDMETSNIDSTDVAAAKMSERDRDEATTMVSTPVPSVHVTQPSINLPESSDEEPVKATTSAPHVSMSTRSRVQRGRVEMLMSDDDDDDEDSRPVLSSRPLQQSPPPTESNAPFFLSPPLAPAKSGGKNELDAFFMDSDSDNEAMLAPSHPAPVKKDSESDDEEEIDRFAAYDAKKTRRRKSDKKQHTLELLSVPLPSSAPSLPTPPKQPIAMSADILAAIRQAEEDALRLLGPTEASDNGNVSALSSYQSSEVKPMKEKSSSRRKSRGSEDADGSKKTRKSKKHARRRDEVLLTDEDE